MPCTSDRKVQSRVKHSRIERAARLSAESSDTSSEREEEIKVAPGPDDLDQSWSYEFKVVLRVVLVHCSISKPVSGPRYGMGSHARGLVSGICCLFAAHYTSGKREPNSEHPPIMYNARLPFCNLITAAVGKILDGELLERWQEGFAESIALEWRCQTRH